MARLAVPHRLEDAQERRPVLGRDRSDAVVDQGRLVEAPRGAVVAVRPAGAVRVVGNHPQEAGEGIVTSGHLQEKRESQQ